MCVCCVSVEPKAKLKNNYVCLTLYKYVISYWFCSQSQDHWATRVERARHRRIHPKWVAYIARVRIAHQLPTYLALTLTHFDSVDAKVKLIIMIVLCVSRVNKASPSRTNDNSAKSTLKIITQTINFNLYVFTMSRTHTQAKPSRTSNIIIIRGKYKRRLRGGVATLKTRRRRRLQRQQLAQQPTKWNKHSKRKMKKERKNL